MLNNRELGQAWKEFEERVEREINPGQPFDLAIKKKRINEIELYLLLHERPDLIPRIPGNGHYNMGGHLIKIL